MVHVENVFALRKEGHGGEILVRLQYRDSVVDKMDDLLEERTRDLIVRTMVSWRDNPVGIPDLTVRFVLEGANGTAKIWGADGLDLLKKILFP